jgi:glycosyltransferase involved in cell wall biosynthesis
MTKLLLVGPLPPPVVGPTRSFELFCDETKRYASIETDVVDSSAKRLKQETHWLSPQTWRHAWRVARGFFPKLTSNDCVVIFATYGFLLSMGPLLVNAAKLLGKPCYVRTFAGNLDQYYESLPIILKRLLLTTLKRVDGLIVQTQLLGDYFRPLLGEYVHVIPNYRPLEAPQPGGQPPPRVLSEKTLRLIYVASVREDKGIFVLFDSLDLIAKNGCGQHILCDIYGPVHPQCENRFFTRLSEIPQAQYKGILDLDEVVPTMQNYDALVLPTYHKGEGHPGVIIEAMIAGIPAITTDFRSIPELVQDGENGLLVEPCNPRSLAQAIGIVYSDRDLLSEMSIHNFEKRDQYEIRHCMGHMLDIMEIDIEI